MRRPASILLPALLLAAAAATPLAAKGADLDKKVREAKTALQRARAREKGVLTVLTRHQGELNRIQDRLESIDRQLRAAEMRADDARRDLMRVEGELSSLERGLASRRKLLAGRIDALYRYGPLSYLEVFFSAASFAELVNRYEMTRYLMRYDQELIAEYQRSYRQLEGKRRQVAQIHRELSSRAQAIDSLKSEAEKQKRLAARKVQLTQEQLDRIRADAKAQEALLREYEQLSRKLGTEIRRKSSAIALGTGRMRWPLSVTGRLSSGFGWRRHPVLKKKKFHNGQDIAVPVGTPVLAADSGIVRIAGWRGGYGYLVAVDHGRGIATFYGHNSVLLVREGEAVVKGQRLALSGNTGLSTGPHLHFEVRVRGNPVNPLAYLP